MISVIIPAYNAEKLIRGTLQSLKFQTFDDYEVIVVDDHSTDKTLEITKEFSSEKIKVFQTAKNSGPAKARNIGIKKAKGNIIAFTDSDCIITNTWLRDIANGFEDKKIYAVTGRVQIPKSTLLGDAISDLGFPAGGNLGFEKMWKVSKERVTNQLVTCNCAVRKAVIDKVGLFDETLPMPFGEDTEFGLRVNSKFPIYYLPTALVLHVPRTDLKSFIRWAFIRGKGIYYMKQKIKMQDYLKLRLWSSMNVISNALTSYRAPLTICLFSLYVILQQIGLAYESLKK